MTRKTILCIVSACVALSFSAHASSSTFWPFKKKQPVVEQKDTVVKRSKYDKMFEKEEKASSGFITTHLMSGKVYFEIPDSVIGREMLLGTTVKSTSNNAEGIVGSKNGLVHFTFTKTDSVIYMRRLNTDYMTSDKNIRRALARSTVAYVMRKFPVKAFSNDSSAYVIDATPLFLSGDKELSPFSSYAKNAEYVHNDSFKKDLSYVTDVKSFEDNLAVSACLTYGYSLSRPNTGEKVLDKATLTADVCISILLLPEEPYHPRMADPRIGFFFTERHSFGDVASTSKPVYFTNRWRLEPSDTSAYMAGEKVTPVKPVTFYIDNTFPEWWKPYIRDAVEQWNEVFEEIGFKNAVVAKDFPTDDPDFDPDNIKYSCIRYAPIGIQNAMGPSWVDPRSGEIVNASVYVYHDVIKLISNWMFVQTSQADEMVRTRDIPQELLGDALMYVIKHEVGHTLGLMHNMSGSSVIPVDSLRSPSFTAKYGTTTSIMDYARFNYVAQPGDKERGVKLTPPRFGVYDKWAIRWGYAPVFGARDFEEETAMLTGMITDSLKAAPFYRYGKQQMAYVYFDPSCQNEDLGDDVLAASKYGIENLKYILPNLISWISDADDPEYEYRTSLYMGILNQYIRYMNHLIFNIGGLYRYEVLAEDSADRFANVPRNRQLEIMEFVCGQYGDLDWIDNRDVISKLPIIGTPSVSVRNAITSTLFMTPYFEDRSDGVATKEFSMTECMDAIFKFVWKSAMSGRKLSASDRRVQTSFVDSYLSMGGFPMPKTEKGKSGLYDDHICTFCHDVRAAGELVYDPVSGFEWLPSYKIATGEYNQSFLYAVLNKAYALMKSRKASASKEDAAHYEYLMGKINYSLKIEK